MSINSKAIADTSQPQNGLASYSAGLPWDNDHALDAGMTVPPPSVSVRDFVWKDTNGDGIEDVGEPGIHGVVLTLTGPGDTPVTDIHGQPVGPQTTDSSGHYEFTDLPTLPEGKHYTVTIDQTKSADASKGLVPTVTGGNSQSHTGSATSTEPLDANGDADNTLDFGFKREYRNFGVSGSGG